MSGRKFFNGKHADFRGQTPYYTEHCLEFVADYITIVVKKTLKCKVTKKDFSYFKEMAKYSLGYQFQYMTFFVMFKKKYKELPMSEYNTSFEIMNEVHRLLALQSRKNIELLEGDFYEIGNHFTMYDYLLSCMFFGDKELKERLSKIPGANEGRQNDWRILTGLDKSKFVA